LADGAGAVKEGEWPVLDVRCWVIGAGAALLALAQPAATQAQARVAASSPRPAIWLLEDADTKIYLFGTIHILPPGFKWRSAALDRVVARADELVVETRDEPGEDPFSESAMLFFAEDPAPILERVPADKREALRRAIAAGPVPEAAYDLMHTWAAAITLGLAALRGEYGVVDAQDAPGAEDVLEELFRKAGKPIGSVEDPLDILRDLNALPAAVQAQLLVHSVEQLAAPGGELDNSEQAWAAGRAEEMAVGEEQGLPPALYEILIRKRNAAWTQWLERRLARPGIVLFAVGAGHLAGPDSVQNMLAARGLRARRID
jgi:uncharacterized protein YbaP (TraB family)